MDALPAHMRPERSFQGFILALQRFWAEQGCVILQPYDMEMGAGTFHPATTLRALGPKRWRARMKPWNDFSGRIWDGSESISAILQLG